jgi:excisionase family DNA binding protein
LYGKKKDVLVKQNLAQLPAFRRTQRDTDLSKAKISMTWDNAPSVLTVDEAATLVRISRNAAYEAIRLGFLPAHNFGQRRIRVAKAVLQQAFGIKSADKPSTAAFSQTGGE